MPARCRRAFSGRLMKGSGRSCNYRGRVVPVIGRLGDYSPVNLNTPYKPAHAEGHWLAASGAIEIYRAIDSSKYCMARLAYCIFRQN